MSTKVYAPFTATRRSGAAAPAAGADVLLLARRRLAHDSVRNAMQLTVTDVAAVELRREAQHLPAFSHARANTRTMFVSISSPSATLLRGLGSPPPARLLMSARV
jgi:hypothetical protein